MLLSGMPSRSSKPNRPRDVKTPTPPAASGRKEKTSASSAKDAGEAIKAAAPILRGGKPRPPMPSEEKRLEIARRAAAARRGKPRKPA